MAKYTVKQGDSLLKIAKRFGVSTNALLNSNAGVSSISPGIVLRIPTSGWLGPGERDEPKYVPPPTPIWKGPGERDEPPYIPPPKTRVPPAPPAPPAYTGPYTPPTYTSPYGPSYTAPTPPPKYIGPYAPTKQPSQPPPGIAMEIPTGVTKPLPGIAGEPTALPMPPDTYANLNRIFGNWYGSLPRTNQVRVLPRMETKPLTGIAGQTLYPKPSTPPPPGISAPMRVGEYIPRESQMIYTGLPYAPQPEAKAPIPTPPGTKAEVDKTTGVISYRMINADGTVGRSYRYSTSEDDVGPDGRLTEKAVSKYEDQRAEHVEMSIRRGDWPMLIHEHDRLALGFTEEEMNERGYAWNEKGYWEFAGTTEGPQVTGTAMPYTGYGYSYGGGGRGKYPTYTYPSGGGGSYQPYTPYQNLVRPEIAGRVPQQIQSRPGRFGMVTWRV